jgi:citrate lyase subunit beta/citryl-CoA lyase
LFEPGDAAPALPVCDHYAGAPARMRKSLAMQAEMGPVFDITLDCEDGAPVGGEIEHALRIAELVASPLNRHDRVGARLHPVRHSAFGIEADILIRDCGQRLAYLMLPKVHGLADLQRGCDEIDRLSRMHGHGWRRAAPSQPLPPGGTTPKASRGPDDWLIPLHVLIESHGALAEVAAIAAHPRVESLSFGLMDFVSAHRGAIPQSAMSATGQFEHPLVVRAKLEIAAACHAHAKTPSHSVVTEFKQPELLEAAAEKAARSFGYTRMWSIHPDQIQTIVDAFAPSAAEVDQAVCILLAAQAAQWAPIGHPPGATAALHDRASYRYFWHVLELAHRTGQPLPEEARHAFFDGDAA